MLVSQLFATSTIGQLLVNNMSTINLQSAQIRSQFLLQLPAAAGAVPNGTARRSRRSCWARQGQCQVERREVPILSAVISTRDFNNNCYIWLNYVTHN